MKLLVVHNFYQHPGGEDAVFASECSLLESKGHKVIRFTHHNNDVRNLSKTQLVTATIWNKVVYQELRNLIKKERPDLAHFHNTFPLVSPSAYIAAKAEGISVVQTLHNYRLLCPNGLLFRQGLPCEDCITKKFPFPGIIHSCYRGEFLASGVVAMMLGSHHTLGTWQRKIDIYIALSDFSKKKFIQGGIPSHKIMVKPNLIYPEPSIGNGGGNYALFIGRLSPEKGIDNLLKAWQYIGEKLPLRIIGDGPLSTTVARAIRASPKAIKWFGHQSSTTIYDHLREAKCLVIPSECYETFGRVAVEALAVGTPVIVSNIGAPAEIITDGKTGFHFKAGNVIDLVAKVELLLSHSSELNRMRIDARTEFDTKYTSSLNYRLLMQIYGRALGRPDKPCFLSS